MMKHSIARTVTMAVWFVTIIWTVILLLVLLKPSGGSSPTHGYTLDAFLHTFFSFDFEIYDYFEAAGHVLLFIILTALWNLAISKHVTHSQAFYLTICVVLTAAFGTEIGQFFVNRSSMLLDLLANILGISATSAWILNRNKK